MKTPFETMTCGRCGGTGSYSFNLMHGSTCYGCGGSGTTLTKRGKEAKSYYERLLVVETHKLTTEHSVFVEVGTSVRRKWQKVINVRADEFNGGTIVETKLCSFGGRGEFMAVKTEAERLEAVAKALTYQATLTKLGKPTTKKAA